jgi:hypothetical protein
MCPQTKKSRMFRPLDNVLLKRRAPDRCVRINWLLTHPLPPLPPPVSKLDQRHMGRLRMRDNLQTGEREGKGMGEEPNLRPQETLVLYKSFNTSGSIV